MTRKDRGKKIMEDKIIMEGIIMGVIIDTIMKEEIEAGVEVEVEAEAGIEIEVEVEAEVGIIKVIIIIKILFKYNL